MADDGEQQPSGPPEYKVFRQRRGIFSRLRKPDLPGPPRPARRRLEAAGRP
jgi:hypothetical protein